jgi:hypothetical protein
MNLSNLFNKTEQPIRGRSNLKALSLFVLVTVSAYLYTLYCGYIWDDERHVLMDSSLWGLAGLCKIWFSSEMQQYYPLIYSSFWIEANLWGLNPAISHTVNALIHALNAFLLYAVLKHLHIRGALFAGLIFALHPVHVESVAWISERKNVALRPFLPPFLYAFLKRRQARKRDCTSFLSSCSSWRSLQNGRTLPAAILIIRWMRARDIRDICAPRPFFRWACLLSLLLSGGRPTSSGRAGSNGR